MSLPLPSNDVMVEGGRTRDDEGSGGGGEGSASAAAAERAMKSKAEVARLLEAQGHYSVRSAVGRPLHLSSAFIK